MDEEDEPDWDKIREMRELNDRIQEHDATQMEYHLNSLWSSHYTLIRNYQEFMKSVEEYEVTGEERLDNYMEGNADRFKIARDYTPEEASQESFLEISPDREEEIFVFLRECVRDLTNYATSANSLYHHAQEFRKKWMKPEIKDQYYEKLEEHNIEKKNKLVRNFREYITHYRSIPLSIHEHENFVEDTRNIGLTISREKLEEGNWLHSASKNYIEEMNTRGSNKEKIDVPWVIQQHKEAVDPFYNWLTEAMYDSYSEEFEELEALREDYEEMTKK